MAHKYHASADAVTVRSWLVFSKLSSSVTDNINTDNKVINMNQTSLMNYLVLQFYCHQLLVTKVDS